MIAADWIWIVGLVIAGILLMNLLRVRASIVDHKGRVDKAWREIENTLLDRRNRIPALIKALENHAASRNQAIDWVRNFGAAVRQASTRCDVGMSDPKERAKREDELSKRLRALVGLAGTYPDVIGNPEYREALERLQSTVDHIASAERYYNDQVGDYNATLEGVPNRQIAGLLKFRPGIRFRLRATHQHFEGGDEDNELHQFFARR